MPPPTVSFEGLTNFDNISVYNLAIIPPDMSGDVGPAHYVQAVNSLVRIFDKNGTPLTEAFPISDIFAPLGTACALRNDGDPIVLYDPLADRWLVSQFCTNFPPFRQLIAVSKGSDPTHGYHLFEFVMPNIRLGDFPKFGVWTDAYYMSTEEFTGSEHVGMGAFAFDRAKMLSGDPTASYLYFSRPPISTFRLGNLLPSDLDGLNAPPAGTPNVFAGYSATEYGESADAIRLFDFHADFGQPSNATFTEREESPIAVAAFDPTSPDGRMDITQPPPGERLDSNSDRLNFRAAYRELSSGALLVLNQTVRLSQQPYRSGVRVYELRKDSGRFSVAGQSTIGDISSSRWIGSAAQDNAGNIGVGYNHVSETEKPSIRYSGRLASEPPGQFRPERDLVNGTGVQKAFGWRWGDYSSMTVDPVDDCTFWMTGQYYTLASQEFSDFTWLTRVGSFRFTECTAGPKGSITGSITNAATGEPIENARLNAGPYSRETDGNGRYGPMFAVPGSYALTASAFGFRTQTFVVPIANGEMITRNFALDPVPVIVANTPVVNAESCGPNHAPDPGEDVSIAVTLRNTGALPANSLTAVLEPSKDITVSSGTQDYGSLTPGGPSVTRSFGFRISPTVVCGSSITLEIRLLDNGKEVSLIRLPVATGTERVAFSEPFDRSPRGFLPFRWQRSSMGTTGMQDPNRNWQVSATRYRSAGKALFSPDVNQIGIGDSATPFFPISTEDARVKFSNWYEIESTFLRNRLYDGAVMEINIGGSGWQDIVAAGGSFESGGYDGVIDSCCLNPLGGRLGWSGRSGINAVPDWITTSVRLPAAAAGQLIRLRFRMGTDIGGFREGMYIDDLTVTDGHVCACMLPQQP